MSMQGLTGSADFIRALGRRGPYSQISFLCRDPGYRLIVKVYPPAAEALKSSVVLSTAIARLFLGATQGELR